MDEDFDDSLSTDFQPLPGVKNLWTRTQYHNTHRPAVDQQLLQSVKNHLLSEIEAYTNTVVSEFALDDSGKKTKHYQFIDGHKYQVFKDDFDFYFVKTPLKQPTQRVYLHYQSGENVPVNSDIFKYYLHNDPSQKPYYLTFDLKTRTFYVQEDFTSGRSCVRLAPLTALLDDEEPKLSLMGVVECKTREQHALQDDTNNKDNNDDGEELDVFGDSEKEIVDVVPELPDNQDAGVLNFSKWLSEYEPEDPQLQNTVNVLQGFIDSWDDTILHRDREYGNGKPLEHELTQYLHYLINHDKVWEENLNTEANECVTKGKKALYPYQYIFTRAFDPSRPTRGALAFMYPGSGKTLIMAELAAKWVEAGKFVIMILTEDLQQNFEKEAMKCVTEGLCPNVNFVIVNDDDVKVPKPDANVLVYSYSLFGTRLANALGITSSGKEAKRTTSTASMLRDRILSGDAVIIIDEPQNIMYPQDSAVSKKKVESARQQSAVESAKQATQLIPERLRKLFLQAEDNGIEPPPMFLLTGTPFKNHPYEVVKYIKMIDPKRFPNINSEFDFNKRYINSDGAPMNRREFKENLAGLIFYVNIENQQTRFAAKKIDTDNPKLFNRAYQDLQKKHFVQLSAEHSKEVVGALYGSSNGAKGKVNQGGASDLQVSYQSQLKLNSKDEVMSALQGVRDVFKKQYPNPLTKADVDKKSPAGQGNYLQSKLLADVSNEIEKRLVDKTKPLISVSNSRNLSEVGRLLRALSTIQQTYFPVPLERFDNLDELKFNPIKLKTGEVFIQISDIYRNGKVFLPKVDLSQGNKDDSGVYAKKCIRQLTYFLFFTRNKELRKQTDNAIFTERVFADYLQKDADITIVSSATRKYTGENTTGRDKDAAFCADLKTQKLDPYVQKLRLMQHHLEVSEPSLDSSRNRVTWVYVTAKDASRLVSRYLECQVSKTRPEKQKYINILQYRAQALKSMGKTSVSDSDVKLFAYTLFKILTNERRTGRVTKDQHFFVNLTEFTALEGRALLQEQTTAKTDDAVINHPKNVNGSLVKIVIGDRDKQEGISIFHADKCIIMQAPATYADYTQAIARVVRSCGHRYVSKDDWTVRVYTVLASIDPNTFHFSAANSGSKDAKRLIESVGGDSYEVSLFQMAKKSYRNWLSFVLLIIESSVDCMLNAERTKHAIPELQQLYCGFSELPSVLKNTPQSARNLALEEEHRHTQDKMLNELSSRFGQVFLTYQNQINKKSGFKTSINEDEVRAMDVQATYNAPSAEPTTPPPVSAAQSPVMQLFTPGFWESKRQNYLRTLTTKMQSYFDKRQNLAQVLLLMLESGQDQDYKSLLRLVNGKEKHLVHAPVAVRSLALTYLFHLTSQFYTGEEGVGEVAQSFMTYGCNPYFFQFDFANLQLNHNLVPKDNLSLLNNFDEYCIEFLIQPPKTPGTNPALQQLCSVSCLYYIVPKVYDQISIVNESSYMSHLFSLYQDFRKNGLISKEMTHQETFKALKQAYNHLVKNHFLPVGTLYSLSEQSFYCNEDNLFDVLNIVMDEADKNLIQTDLLTKFGEVMTRLLQQQPHNGQHLPSIGDGLNFNVIVDYAIGSTSTHNSTFFKYLYNNAVQYCHQSPEAFYEEMMQLLYYSLFYLAQFLASGIYLNIDSDLQFEYYEPGAGFLAGLHHESLSFDSNPQLTRHLRLRHFLQFERQFFAASAYLPNSAPVQSTHRLLRLYKTGFPDLAIRNYKERDLVLFLLAFGYILKFACSQQGVYQEFLALVQSLMNTEHFDTVLNEAKKHEGQTHYFDFLCTVMDSSLSSSTDGTLLSLLEWLQLKEVSTFIPRLLGHDFFTKYLSKHSNIPEFSKWTDNDYKIVYVRSFY